MKNKLIFLIAIAVAVVLSVYMVMFQVRYDQVAVRTTWDQAVEPTRDADGNITDPGSLILEPGYGFKWPTPIQKVKVYSKRVQLLEDQSSEIQTADNQAVIVKFYLAWKIEDPYAFFLRLKDEAEAESQLLSMLSELKVVVSNYRFDQLVNPDPEKVKLAEIEQKGLEMLRGKLDAITPGYGIKLEQVGIRRIILPEDTTQKVFERMAKTREQLAEKARAEGDAEANNIQARAEAAKRRILAFAERRAQAIRDEGNREAAQYFSAFREDQDFAIFQRQIEALQQMLANNTTFVLDANKLWFLNALEGQGPKPSN
ncbi:MAG: protease modulator HflC [Phycisphaerales bacterium]